MLLLAVIWADYWHDFQLNRKVTESKRLQEATLNSSVFDSQIGHTYSQILLSQAHIQWQCGTDFYQDTSSFIRHTSDQSASRVTINLKYCLKRVSVKNTSHIPEPLHGAVKLSDSIVLIDTSPTWKLISIKPSISASKSDQYSLYKSINYYGCGWMY